MKAYKTTKKQIEDVKKGLNKFIRYVNNYCMEYKRYYDDMEMTNKMYSEDPKGFLDRIGTDATDFRNRWLYYKMLEIAETSLKEIENIHNNIIAIFIDPNGDEYPVKVLKWLDKIQLFCFDNNGNFLSLDEQNNRLKKYSHFDASTKKPKTYNLQ